MSIAALYAFRTDDTLSEEAQVLLDISRAAHGSLSIEDAIAEIGSLLLSIAGVTLVTIEAHIGMKSLRVEQGVRSLGAEASAVAFIAASGEKWGKLRIYFSPFAIPVDHPLRLATFAGQQLAACLSRQQLNGLRQEYRRTLAVLEYRLERRKLVQRTAGKIAELAATSYPESLRYLIAQARTRRRSLLEVAKNVLAFLQLFEEAQSGRGKCTSLREAQRLR